MFNIGPLELLVLAIVGLVVLGPERLPGLAREAAQMLRTLRDLATGARQQLRDELGPEFADVDLRNLNPRTAVRRAVFGDDFDLDQLNPRTRLRDAILGDEDLQAADPRTSLRETRDAIRYNGHDPERHASDTSESPVRMTKPVTRPVPDPPGRRPRPSPHPRTTFDDAT